ncbi:MAG: GntR family transcriptional regulator [Candidatus Rokuibacteriota bacterium]
MARAATAYHPSVPLHHQIQRVLRSKIESGEWAPNDGMPTELALVERFRVSRTTIREALGALTRDGLIVRQRGRGSFIAARRRGPARPGMVTNLILGYDAEVRVVAAEPAPAPAHVVEWLGVPRGAPIRRFVRVEVVDGAPLAVVVNYMRPALGARIRPRDLTRLTMLEVLRDRLGIALGPIREQIEARLPDDEVAGLLGIDLTQPVLVLRLIVDDGDGRCLQVSDAFYRGDRYRYEMETRLPPAGPPRPGHRTPSRRRSHA